jgi:hypothetical protein
VIGNERLLSDLERKYPDRNTMNIIKLDKSGGVNSIYFLIFRWFLEIRRKGGKCTYSV